MLIVSAIAMLVFVLTCSAVGLTLLWRARDGGAAEWLCGLGFTLIGLLGYPLTAASGNGALPVEQVRLSLVATGTLFTDLGLACFFVFTLLVFRNGVAWARGLAGAAIAMLAITGIGQVQALAEAAPGTPSFEATWGWSVGVQGLCVLCFGWIGVEGFRQYIMSRRRLALGMGDPVTSDRLRLWAIFGGSTTLMVLVLFAIHLTGNSATTSLTGQLSMAIFGVTSSVAAALAFFPPDRYLAWVGQRAATA